MSTPSHGKSVVKILFAISVLLLSAAMVLIFQYLSTADQRALKNFDKTEVLVAAETISRGTSLSEAQANNLIQSKVYPSDSIPANTFQKLTEAELNLVALGDIAPGQILVKNTFGERVAPVIDFNLPAGKVAVTVELNYASRVGAFIKPGVNVAVFSSLTGQNGGNQSTSMLFKSLQVLAVGEQSNSEQVAATAETSNFITLAVNFNDAARLIQAYEGAKLHLALLNGSSLVGSQPAEGQR